MTVINCEMAVFLQYINILKLCCFFLFRASVSMYHAVSYGTMLHLQAAATLEEVSPLSFTLFKNKNEFV